MKIRRFTILVMILLAVGVHAAHAEGAQKPNVLFIAIDDLNDWVGYLKVNGQTITPNFDKFAARCMVMEKAYCASPCCNPSRAALMSGLRPGASAVYDNSTDWRKNITDVPTLPMQFRANGYWAGGSGKIYHESFRRDSDWDDYLKPGEVDEDDPMGGGKTKGKGKNKGKADASAINDGVGGIKFMPLDCEDKDLEDYKIVSYAIKQLNAPHDKPIFLACGVHKPHMPWNVPRKYYDMHPLADIQLPPHLDNDLDDVPPGGIKMAKPEGDHKQILESGRWKDAIQGYLAAISFCDANLGRLFDAIEKSPLKDNLIICLWSDHGWHLGEKQHWRKFALWERATHAPMLWYYPGMKPGQRCSRPVDYMSIYPTLCDLAGIPTPKHNQGVSIRPLLENPAATWTTPAVTTWLFNNHAVRNDGWRYIRYNDGGEELYDETKDPNEWTNLAKDSKYDAIKAELAKWVPTQNSAEPKAKDRNDKDKAANKANKKNKNKNKE